MVRFIRSRVIIGFMWCLMSWFLIVRRLRLLVRLIVLSSRLVGTVILFEVGLFVLGEYLLFGFLILITFPESSSSSVSTSSNGPPVSSEPVATIVCCLCSWWSVVDCCGVWAVSESLEVLEWPSLLA